MYVHYNNICIFIFVYTFVLKIYSMIINTIQACVIKRNLNINIFLMGAYGEDYHQYNNCHNTSNYQYHRHTTFI